MTLKRFGVSIPEDLLVKFDEIVRMKGYIGRSEAIRDAMRGYISQVELESGQEGTVASLNIIYRHKPRLMAELTKAQHDAHVNVISTIHVHVSHSHCLEVITLKGDKQSIDKMTNKISGLKGIEYVRLFMFVLPEGEEVDQAHYH
ncbi:MAG: nickel-responsive transcriptional regulator NikR [Candidatus Thorarchaeota archaeon]